MLRGLADLRIDIAAKGMNFISAWNLVMLVMVRTEPPATGGSWIAWLRGIP